MYIKMHAPPQCIFLCQRPECVVSVTSRPCPSACNSSIPTRFVPTTAQSSLSASRSESKQVKMSKLDNHSESPVYSSQIVTVRCQLSCFFLNQCSVLNSHHICLYILDIFSMKEISTLTTSCSLI